jgi:hypothetical protein
MYHRNSPSQDELATLLKFAETERQVACIEAVQQHKSIHRASKHLGIDPSVVSRQLSAVRKRAQRRGYDPSHDQTHATPEGQYAKGVSTLYDDAGNVRMQWVKSQAEEAEREGAFRALLEALKEDVPRAPAVKLKTAERRDDLMNVHVVTDYHLGMYSWAEETGADWDLSIAENLLTSWFETAIRIAPPAKLGVLCQLGDFLHFDSLEAVTPTNRHLLDADTRFQKIVRVGIRALRRIVRGMLEKYERVHLILADANHDPASSAWLREVFAAFYDHEPRITVDNTADTYYCLEFGKTLTFYHHGHKRKPATIDDVLVAKFREQFGRAKYVYCHMGHLHFKQTLETNLMLIEQHRTLAAKDAWASRSGYMSGREAQCITYSSEYGEVSRLIINPEMVAC